MCLAKKIAFPAPTEPPFFGGVEVLGEAHAWDETGYIQVEFKAVY